jgi:23S rRNA (uracil1939-C5)-methyltransferase
MTENDGVNSIHPSEAQPSDRPLAVEPSPGEQSWQQGSLCEVAIANLSNSGDGVGRWQDRVVFVPDTVPGDRVIVRLLRVKPGYAHGKLVERVEDSPHRVRPSCIVADKCGGCQWQSVSYDQQIAAKYQQVVEALERIGGLANPPVRPVLPSDPLAYRNKVTYPLRRSPDGVVQAGYYQKNSHRLVNLNQCPVQDARLNPLLAEVKLDIQTRGWSIYDEDKHRGKLRHLGLRIGRRTGEMLLTLVSTAWALPGLEEQAEQWMQRYPNLVGVAINQNGDRTNAIFGAETRCVAGRSYLREQFADLEFNIHPNTFFQVNTEQAEVLVRQIESLIPFQGTETLVDVYCGIGTLTLPLARRVKQAVGLEVQAEAIAQAWFNAELNSIENVRFEIGAVETHLAPLFAALDSEPDIVLLDPPRKGCDPSVLNTLMEVHPRQLIYMSCNPSTLARDLKVLCHDGGYQLQVVQPADFFPQTPHVECVAFLVG